MDRDATPARQASAALVGRDAEVLALERFLTGDAPPRALVLEGEAGIGKTALWEAALDCVRRTGCPLLSRDRLRRRRDSRSPGSSISSTLVALAKAYDESAAAALGDAAASYDHLGLGFDQARSLLPLGRAQRRSRQRGAARRSLEQAADVFERLGCPGWGEQARSELVRISGRRPAQEGRLTAAERRVAELAAGGLSNKEIAGQLVVSVYTVQTHLRHAYEKLGIRSRTQVAAALAKDH